MTGSELSEPERYLRQAGELPAEEIDLPRAALALASRDRPRVPLERYLAHLDELAAAVEPARGVDGKIAAVNTALFDQMGYGGDRETYDDLQNANLMRVIDRRKGLPIALAVLWLHAARAHGWTAGGVNFPGHFLVAIEERGQRALVDVFNDGHPCGAAELRALLKVALGEEAELRPEHYAPADNRAILMRLQNNIKSRLIHARDYHRALAALEPLLWLAPAEGRLWHEAGALHAATENFVAAADALERAVALGPDDALRHEATALLQRVRARLN